MKLINSTSQITEEIEQQEPIVIDKDIEAGTVETSDAIKKHIEISYNNDGVPNKTKIPLGVQWDNRVTWLSFDFTEYLWNTDSKDDDDYTNENKFDKYTFRIFFKINDDESLAFPLDPEVPFEVPRPVTEKAGTYQMSIVIEEIKEELDYGNVFDKTEIYVTKAVQCVVEDNWFKPEILINYYEGNTYQRKGLTKKWIDGSLASAGNFFLNSKFLGTRADSYVKYVRFKDDKFPVQLQDLDQFIGFYNAETGEAYFSKFEDADPEDAYDNYQEGFPRIAWVPDKVTQNESIWSVCIIAYAGIYDDIRHHYILDSEEYIFYCSKVYGGCYVKGFLSQADLEKQFTQYAQLYTSDDEEFDDANNQPFGVTAGGDN